MRRYDRVAGYLERAGRVVGGSVRKYYTITDLGREALGEARLKIGELVGEVMDDSASTAHRERH